MRARGYVKAGVRAVVRIVLSVVGLVVVLPLGSLAAASGTSEPGVTHPHWRVVVGSEFLYAGASDRYVAIVHGFAADQLTLIDEQTGTSQTPPLGPCGGAMNVLVFGGSWLLAQCSIQPGTPCCSVPPYVLYNLDSGQWTDFHISPQCQGDAPSLFQAACFAVAIGPYWVKLQANAGPSGHEKNFYYLQNIQTGELKPDPITPGGNVFDDLGAPSGSSQLCAPLRYPTVYNSAAGEYEPGSLTFYGQFALTHEGDNAPGPLSHLRRCGSSLNLMLHGTDYPPALASSRAVIADLDGATFPGWFLPSLWPFRLSPPATQDLPCGHGTEGVVPVALTARTIYVACPQAGRLWSATLPPPAAPAVRCIVPNVKKKTLSAARTALRAAHCQLGRVAHAHSAHVKHGRVISSKPRPGTVLANHGKVQLTLSSGKRS